MDPEIEGRAAEILADALELPAAERPEFVRSACGDEAAVRSRVEELLAAYAWGEEAQRSTGLVAGVRAAATELLARRVGLRFGPYQITRLLATGGMGEVYLAERFEGDFDQRVAVKFLRAGMSSGAPLQRFRAERQLLARLRHPNLARLIDGGATPEGEPYLVMEFVDGVPLDRHCDDRRLRLRERLEIFCTVCEVVQYAHRNLVVHRDLKPANIFVDADDQVKLLDFGIAKILEADDTSADVTATAQRPMTPRYASPEQLRGEDITTASDVYSLGVVLFELLTGRSPYRAENTRSAEFVREVFDQPTPAPSAEVSRAPAAVSAARGTTPGGLERALRGDLDTIVLRALRKEPERRYASAEEFMNDIRRHLAGMPVLARPDTLRYRLAKFTRRNPAVVAAVGVAFASLSVGLVLSVTQYRSAVLAREREQREHTEARWLAYLGSVSAAESSIRTNRLLEARRQLDAAPTEHRGWEWRHLASRLDRSRLSIAGHEGAVTGVRFTPDGERIVSTSEDRTVRIWDARTGAPLARYGPLEAVPRSLAIDSRGELAAVGMDRGRVHVLDLSDGRAVLSLADPDTLVYWLPEAPVEMDSQITLLNRASTWATVEFDPASDLLSVGYYSGVVQFWNPRSQRLTDTWRVGGIGKLVLRFRPAHGQLAIGHEYAPPELRELGDGRVVRRFETGQGQMELCLDPTGRRLAVASQSRSVEVWDAESGRLFSILGGRAGPVRAMAFDPSGEFLVSAALDQTVRVSDVRTGVSRWAYPGHTANVHCLAQSPDGSRLVTGDWDGLLKVWDFETEDVRTLVLTPAKQATRRIWSEDACLSPDGTRLVTSMCQFWDLARGRPVGRLDSPQVGAALAWIKSGHRVVMGMAAGEILVLDPDTGGVLERIQGHAGDVSALASHPRLPLFVSGSRDSTVQVWELGPSRAVRKLTGSGGAVLSVCYDLEGRRIASGAEHGAIHIWDAQDGRLLHVLRGHEGAVRRLAFSPDGSLLASASFDGSVRLWDPRAGSAIGKLFQGSRPIYAVAFTHDGTRLAAGGADGVVHVFDPAARREVARLHGHDERIFWLEFAPQDTALLSSSLDGSVRIWDVIVPPTDLASKVPGR